jgi:2',3'-cyclic-nucleotide 2'-phosphodiesterase (5'-nucleotidase family)
MKASLLLSLSYYLLANGAAVKFQQGIHNLSPAQEQELTILHTDDIHSHFDEVNRFAQIARLLKSNRMNAL